MLNMTCDGSRLGLSSCTEGGLGRSCLSFKGQAQGVYTALLAQGI